MGSTDVECKVDGLAGGPALDVGGVVGILEALAQPDVVFSSAAVGLRGCDLELALDVAVRVGRLIVVGLLSAGGLHCRTRETGGGRGDAAMGGDGGEETG